mgnify:CR=1 FL=1
MLLLQLRRGVDEEAGASVSLVAISASLKAMLCWAAMGLPNWTRALGVGHGLFHGALGNAQSLGRDADAAAVQGLHGDLEALALLAQQVLLGNDAVGEHDLGGGGAVQAHLLFVLAHGEAGEAALHDEAEMPRVPLDLSVMAKTTNTSAT